MSNDREHRTPASLHSAVPARQRKVGASAIGTRRPMSPVERRYGTPTRRVQRKAIPAGDIYGPTANSRPAERAAINDGSASPSQGSQHAVASNNSQHKTNNADSTDDAAVATGWLTKAQTAIAVKENPIWAKRHGKTPGDFGVPSMEVDSPEYAEHIALFQVSLGLNINGVAGPETVHELITSGLAEEFAKIEPGTDRPERDDSQGLADAGHGNAGSSATEGRNATSNQDVSSTDPNGGIEIEDVAIHRAESQQPTDGLPPAEAKSRVDQLLKPVATLFEDFRKKAKRLRAKYPRKITEKIRAAQERVDKYSSRPGKAATRAQHRLDKLLAKRAIYIALKPGVVAAEQALDAAIASVRPRIASIADEPTRRYAYLQLNKYTPYQYQMDNANILHSKRKTAGTRTCNTTSITMVLQALGKTKASYEKGTPGRMRALAAAMQGPLSARGSTADLASISFDDFVQLTAVNVYLQSVQDDAVPEDAIAAARTHAARTNITTVFLLTLLDHWGCSVKLKRHKMAGGLSAISTVTRKAKNRSEKAQNRNWTRQEKMRDYYVHIFSALAEVNTTVATMNDALSAEPASAVDTVTPYLESLTEETSSLPTHGVSAEMRTLVSRALPEIRIAAEKFDALRKHGRTKSANRRLRGLRDVSRTLAKQVRDKARPQDLKYYKAAGSLQDMQTEISTTDYRRYFEKIVSNALSSGQQIVLNLQNHYVRLQSLADDGFVIDDPGRATGETVHVPWELGIADGYFRKYFVVS